MKNSDFVWVAYSSKPPFLPIAVADSAVEMASLVGTNENCVRSTWSHYVSGRKPHSRYHKVRIGCKG